MSNEENKLCLNNVSLIFLHNAGVSNLLVINDVRTVTVKAVTSEMITANKAYQR